MKKVFSLVLVLATVLAAASCGITKRQAASTDGAPAVKVDDVKSEELAAEPAGDIQADAISNPRGTNAPFARVVVERVESRILDSAMIVNVIVPESYYNNPDKKYPVLYLLHGLGGNYTDWEQYGNASYALSAGIGNNLCPEMVIVCPNAGGGDPRVNQHGYFNLKGWRYEDYFFEELMPAIESKYRVIGDKQHRAIAGLSMGGGGTTVYSQHHPELFIAAFPMSAWMYNNNLLNDPAETMKKLTAAVDANNTVEFVRHANAKKLEALRTVFWYVEIGDDDFLLRHNTDFVFAMKDANVPCEFVVRDGAHNFLFWQSALVNTLLLLNKIFQ